MNMSDNFMFPSNFIFGSVNFVNTRILVDSGASRSCIDAKLFRRIVSFNQQNITLRPANCHKLLSASGYLLLISGQVDLNIRINGYVISQTFYVIANLQHPCIIGMDMLTACKAIVNITDRSLNLFVYLTTSLLFHLSTDRKAHNYYVYNSKFDYDHILRL